jgi:hypothetical protein
MNYLPGSASNRDPPDLCLLSSEDCGWLAIAGTSHLYLELPFYFEIRVGGIVSLLSCFSL